MTCKTLLENKNYMTFSCFSCQLCRQINQNLKKPQHTHHYFLTGSANIRIHMMRTSFTVIKTGNYFLVKHVYKGKHTGYINPGRSADVGLPLENYSDRRSLKNKDVLSETKHSYAC